MSVDKLYGVYKYVDVDIGHLEDEEVTTDVSRVARNYEQRQETDAGQGLSGAQEMAADGTRMECWLQHRRVVESSHWGNVMGNSTETEK
jgi:hypothetical protein